MSKKNLIVAGLAAAAIGAHAAEPPKTDIVTGNTTNSTASIIASQNGVTIPLSPDAAIGVKYSSIFGSSLDGRFVAGDMNAAIGIQGDVGSSANHISLGVAKKAGPAVLSLTASGAREDATKALGNVSYDGAKLRGEQIGFGLDTIGLGPLKTVGGYVVSGRTHDTVLDSSESTYTANRIVDTGTSIDTYEDTFGVTTTKNYKGSNYTRAGVHGTANIGDNGELSLDLGREKNNLLGNKTVGGAKGTYYMGEHGKISAYVGTPTSGQHQVGVEYTLPLGSGWSLVPAYSATRGLINEKRAMIQLVWTPGASGYFARPSGEQTLFAKNVVATNFSNPAHEIRNLGSYGKVETTVSAPVLKSSILKSSEVVNNESPTISYGTPVDAIFGPLVYSGGVYHANTSTGSITLGSLAVNDPDGIGSYIVTSSLFGTLASGTGAVPTTVSIPDGTGHFGQTNIITITATDTGTPTRTTTTSLTMSYDY